MKLMEFALILDTNRVIGLLFCPVREYNRTVFFTQEPFVGSGSQTSLPASSGQTMAS